MINTTERNVVNKITHSPIFDYLKPTPLEFMRKLSYVAENNIHIKREDLQPINSFKIRGAYQKISSLNLADLAHGVVAASAGNHAQGVARVCQQLQVEATIVMPEVTPTIKVDAVRAYGAKVVLSGDSYDDAYDHACKISESRHLTLIHPFDDIDVICGQGTIGVEILEQVDSLDYLFVQVGGGGLLSGLLMAIEELSPNTKVIAVEPEGAKTLGVSLQDNKVSKLDEVCSFADGVAVRQIGSHPFEIIKDRIDGYVSVTNDEICSAIQQIHEDTRAIAECSGAVGLAGATKYLKEHSLKDANVAVILSGSNINFQKLEYVAQRYNLGNCHEKLLHLTIPERKGELVKLLTLLNDVNITEIKYRRSDSDDTATLVLGFSSDDVHFLDMKVELLKYTLGYTVKDFSSLDIGKSHLRFMVGDSKFGSTVQSEKFYRLEFPEKKGQLLNVIEKASSDIEVTALNYRNSGQNECSVLIGIDSKQTSKFPVKLSLENFCKVESIDLSF